MVCQYTCFELKVLKDVFLRLKILERQISTYFLLELEKMLAVSTNLCEFCMLAHRNFIDSELLSKSVNKEEDLTLLAQLMTWRWTMGTGVSIVG